MKLEWLKYFIGMLENAASKSKDPSTKVGAVIVDVDEHTVLSTGYNGFPRGVRDGLENVPERYETAYRYLLTCHAELNSILNAARAGTKVIGHTVICNRIPCVACTNAIIQAGIKQIYFQFSPDLDKANLNLTDINEMTWRELSLEWVPVLCAEAGIKLFYYGYTDGKLWCVELDPQNRLESIDLRHECSKPKEAFKLYSCYDLLPSGDRRY